VIEHLVVFKFKQDLGEEKSAELLRLTERFKTEIGGVVGLSAGFNETEETENRHGFSLGLRVTFDNRESLRAYQHHPTHVEFVQAIAGLVEQVVVVDYPF